MIPPTFGGERKPSLNGGGPTVPGKNLLMTSRFLTNLKSANSVLVSSKSISGLSIDVMNCPDVPINRAQAVASPVTSLSAKPETFGLGLPFIGSTSSGRKMIISIGPDGLLGFGQHLCWPFALENKLKKKHTRRLSRSIRFCQRVFPSCLKAERLRLAFCSLIIFMPPPYQ